MIAILTFVTTLTTAVLGIYASLANLRDHRGRLTAHGWSCLIGVVLSGLSAAGLQVYSDLQSENQNEELQSNLNRTLHPLPGLTVRVTFRPDWRKPKFNSYLSKFRAAHTSPDTNATGIAMWEQLKDEPYMRNTVCELEVDFLFYRSPIETSKFTYDLRDSGEDLRLTLNNPCALQDGDNKDHGGKNPWIWEWMSFGSQIHRLDFVVSDTEIDSTSDDWRGNSTVTSLHDLLGAQLIIQPKIATLAPLPDLDDYRQAVRLIDVVIRLPTGVVLQLDEDDLSAFKSTAGYDAYSFTFPSTVDELLEKARYIRFKYLMTDPPPPIAEYMPSPMKAATQCVTQATFPGGVILCKQTTE